MHGNTLTRGARLAAHLLFHPGEIPRYLQTSVQKHRSPLDLQLPWYSYAAIDFLQEHLKPDMNVFEYGSGGSTVFFARRTARVFCVEDNAEWKEKVDSVLHEHGLENVQIIHHPFDVWDAEAFSHSAYLAAASSGGYDVIAVDGSEAGVPLRPLCFKLAEHHIRPGGIIIVDDSWRYPELRVQHRARKHRIFQGTGPCRPGVTTTDIFFY